LYVRVAQESLELYGARTHSPIHACCRGVRVLVGSSLAATTTEVPKRLPYQGERS